MTLGDGKVIFGIARATEARNLKSSTKMPPSGRASLPVTASDGGLCRRSPSAEWKRTVSFDGIIRTLRNFSMKSRCHDWRLYSPSVASLSPTSSWRRTTSRIAACWMRSSSSDSISPFSARSRAAMSASDRMRLPTCSARNGGLLRPMLMVARFGPRTIAHAPSVSCRLRRRGHHGRFAMKAGVASDQGLALRDIAQPRAKSNEVLVKVRAAALNRADLTTARGLPHGSHGGVGAPVGLEWAGEVAETGAEVQGGYKPGARVMCSGTGGYAEYAVTDWGRVYPIPPGMSFEQAATLPVALATLHNAPVTAGRLQPGESVMIQGASSGVGLMGLQIAKLMGAGLVIGSSTNDARRARLEEFGADLAIDTRDAAWPEQVLKATGGKGVALVVDMLSGPVIAQTMKATKILGRIVNVGRLAGTKAEFDFDLHALRRIDYIGVTFRTRTLDEVREIGRRMRADLWDAVTAGKLALPIDRLFPLDRAVEAQARMRANKHFGKIVLTM